MSIDYNQKIPNNVDLSENKTLQRALEHWQPEFINWWQDMGPDDSQNFDGQISGFGIPGAIDFADIAFGAQTTLGFTEAPGNTSGTLTVSDGTHTAAILLLGQYLAANFNMASDGHGGTLVTDPPLPDNQHALLASG